jgi:hypothetical protein
MASHTRALVFTSTFLGAIAIGALTSFLVRDDTEPSRGERQTTQQPTTLDTPKSASAHRIDATPRDAEDVSYEEARITPSGTDNNTWESCQKHYRTLRRVAKMRNIELPIGTTLSTGQLKAIKLVQSQFVTQIQLMQVARADVLSNMAKSKQPDRTSLVGLTGSERSATIRKAQEPQYPTLHIQIAMDEDQLLVYRFDQNQSPELAAAVVDIEDTYSLYIDAIANAISSNK